MKPSQIQTHRIVTVLNSQFPNLNINQILNQIEIKISRKTKRIREIYDHKSQQLLFSLRTSDGRLLPTLEGANRILESGYKGNRIYISQEAVPFVSSGKTAFCKHILKVDNNIIVGSEIFVLDENGTLLAIGTAVQPGYAMLEMNYGAAAKIKHYINKSTLTS